jgi:hypothetical protein
LRILIITKTFKAMEDIKAIEVEPFENTDLFNGLVIQIGNDNDSVKSWFFQVFNIFENKFDTGTLITSLYYSEHNRKPFQVLGSNNELFRTIFPECTFTIYDECCQDEAEILIINHPQILNGFRGHSIEKVIKRVGNNMFWIDGAIKLWDNTITGMDCLIHNTKYDYRKIYEKGEEPERPNSTLIEITRTTYKCYKKVKTFNK